MTRTPPEPQDAEDDPAAVFGAAAHEIKNALGPLAMTLQLAERQLLAGQPIAPSDMAFARAQVRRLSRLVDDLMDLTRADLGLLAVNPREIDLAAVVNETVDTFRRGHAN
ncbi:MAG TPA: histidine kinase dimerization/phospho-acceptor domain-containing protein, partial [Polyangia bacterium]|nr:histidine kinase dimerization/phospho-acceptor domain-containing protein [Polyangia bacterium]